MLETSTDLLKVVLAASVGLFTVFLCWGIFYFVMTLRNVLLITKDARRVFDKVDDVLEAVKDKVHSSTSYLMLIGEAVKKILEFMRAAEGVSHFPKFWKKKKESEKEEPQEKEDIEDEAKKDEETW